MRALVTLALVLTAASPAFANMGAPVLPGAPATETTGIAGIAIEHEDLAFDLRPLEHDGLARVVATYRLANRGAAVTAPLVFVSGSTIDNIRITLDGTPIPTNKHAGDLPPSWQPPATTPALDDGAAPLAYEVHEALAIAFTVTLQPGPHRLEVSYAALPTRNVSARRGTVIWQLAYVTAPARDWASFGDLDITVQLASDWEAATNLALARDGDALRAHFTALPAEPLALTCRAPIGAWHGIARIAAPILLLVVLAGGILLLIRRRHHAGWLALAWGTAIAITGNWLARIDSAGVPANQDAYHGYDRAFATILAILGGLVAIPIGLAIARLTRRTRT